MTKSVIHVLEPVEVEQHDRDALALAQCGRRTGEEQHAVGKPREHVVGRLVRLAVDLVAQLLDEAGSFQAGARVCDEHPKEVKVIVVEMVCLFVTIERNDCSDRSLPVHDRGNDGIAVFACHRIVAGTAVSCGGVVERRVARRNRLRHEGRLIKGNGLNPRGPFVTNRDPARDPRRLGQDEFRTASSHDSANLLEDVEAHRRRLEARRAENATEIVEALQRSKAE